MIQKNPHRSRYEFYLDMSGTLKKSDDDIYIGCILMPDLFKSAFREKFYREFPSLSAYKKKGTTLHPNLLRSVMENIDSQGIKMTCTVLKRYVIKQIERDLKEQISVSKHIPKEKVSLRFFEEKVIASVYFTALSKYGWKGYPYNCFSCMETQFDLHQSFVAMNRISYNKGFHFKMASVPRRTEHMIKFADYIASAGRKIDKFIFDKLKNFCYIDYKPDYEELYSTFGLSHR